MAETDGFGFNTNILETNVLNLAVVIWVLVYFGKDTFINALELRKNVIVKNLEDSLSSKKKFQDEKLIAIKNLENSLNTRNEILAKGFLLMDQMEENMYRQMKKEIKRIEDSKNFLIKVEERKAIDEIVRQVKLFKYSELKILKLF